MVRRGEVLSAAGGALALSLLPGAPIVRARGESSGGAAVEGRQTSLFEARGKGVRGFVAHPGGAVVLAGREGEIVSPAQELPRPITALGAHWQGTVPPGGLVRVLVRWRGARGAWSGWRALPPVGPGEGDGREALFAGPLFLPVPALAVQTRLVARRPDGPLPLTLTSATLTAIHATAAATRGRGRFHRLAAGRGVSILPRVAWGCPPGEQSPDWVPFYQDPTHFVVHHTEGPNSGIGALAQLRSIWYFHTYSRGWGDIGYNYLIDRQGIVYEGRAGGSGVVGAHAEHFNNGTIGIALLGSYQYEAPPRDMLITLARLIALLAEQNGIDPRAAMGGVDGRRYPAIVGHRDVYATFCPGDQVYRLLPLLRGAF